MKKKKSYTHRIIDAVDESDLPMPSKALLRVMAHHADHRTGVGWHGQETLARWVGCSLRTIQTLMAELSRSDSEPVRVERRARFRRDGRGRTSDEWRLVFAGDQPAAPAAYSGSTNPQDVPVSPSPERRLTRNSRRTNPQLTTDQPAAPAGDPHRDPHRDPHSNSAPHSEAGSFALASPSKKSPRPKRKPKPKTLNGEAHKRVVDHYFGEFTAKHGRAPVFDGADGTAVNRLLEKLKGDDVEARRRITNAFGSWRGAKVTIRDVANKPDAFASPEAPRGAPVPVQREGTIRTGSTDWIDAAEGGR